jgi:hypothetical protein
MTADIRPIRLEDEDALRRVMLAALEADAYQGFNAWDLEQELQSILGAPDGTAVAIADGLLCGYVSPAFDDLTVHPEFRRRWARSGLSASCRRGAVAAWAVNCCDGEWPSYAPGEPAASDSRLKRGTR